jgi:hypothetical protein
MSTLQDLTKKLKNAKEKLNLDVLDLNLLGAAESRWLENRKVRITDLVHDFDIASPATIHYRVTKDLVRMKMFKLVSNPEDKREKFVEKGSSFKDVEKVLKGK